MLGKLFKYEFRATSRIFLTAIIGFLIAGIIATVMSRAGDIVGVTEGYIDNTTKVLLTIVSAFIFGISIFVMFGIYFAFSIRHLHTTMNGKDSYFTHIIPASMSKILFTKIVTLIYWLILVIIAMIIYFMIYFSYIFSYSEVVNLFSDPDVWIGTFKGLVTMILSTAMSYTVFAFCLSLLVIPVLSQKKLLKTVAFVVALFGTYTIINKVQDIIYQWFASPVSPYMYLSFSSGFYNELSGEVLTSTIITSIIFTPIFFVLTAYIYKNHKYIGK